MHTPTFEEQLLDQYQQMSPAVLSVLLSHKEELQALFNKLHAEMGEELISLKMVQVDSDNEVGPLLEETTPGDKEYMANLAGMLIAAYVVSFMAQEYQNTGQIFRNVSLTGSRDGYVHQAVKLMRAN